MLSTVLGLGWSVAGGLSHAAGNDELSQIQITDEWNENKLYDKGEIVIYNRIQYEAQECYLPGTPGETPHWKSVDGELTGLNQAK
ncbi:hypothetical protein [Bacillus cereus]|nr:hypothetical protein [Bacillus cereus]